MTEGVDGVVVVVEEACVVVVVDDDVVLETERELRAVLVCDFVAD